MKDAFKFAVLGLFGWWAYSEFFADDGAAGANTGGSTSGAGSDGAGGSQSGADGAAGSGSSSGDSAGAGSGAGAGSNAAAPVWFGGPAAGGITAAERSADSDLANRILARAGTTARNFYQWNWHYEQETGYPGPDPVPLFESVDTPAGVEAVPLTFEQWWGYVNAALVGGNLGRWRYAR